jgi:hypothetical protein
MGLCWPWCCSSRCSCPGATSGEQGPHGLPGTQSLTVFVGDVHLNYRIRIFVRLFYAKSRASVLAAALLVALLVHDLGLLPVSEVRTDCWETNAKPCLLAACIYNTIRSI